ncbi:K+/H+ antiporter subunit F [Tropicimonas isoalkanivorans]|uniref:Multisubunit potassium/proton antiporter, PhaF subunit n=1 Tax=Tropicimonas isoalkanivorans TaxID=441112 RepID=A0A1I1GMQ7_9RHOB|nr:K+/H+ antiporter subunit F [Tropicimonas isoalkanivorans]SFC11168.1 multisubunit potassium/proton antiporter, PhaF subunit [Tropicimonas isoalkanivorans]
MIGFATYFAVACFSIGLILNIWRIRFAPGVVDRILALDTMVINAIALLNVYGILVGTAVYFEVSLLIAMFGFVSTVAYCRFILRGNIIE